MVDKSKLKEILSRAEAERLAKAGERAANGVISDEEMDDVIGGFKEGDKRLCSYNYEIRCPQCFTGNSNDISAQVYNNPEFNVTEYRCLLCSIDFVYDADLHASIEKQYYKTLVPNYNH